MPILPTPERLARFAVRYPWPVVATWGVLLVVAMAFATTVGSVLTTEAKNTVDTESSRAEALLDALRSWTNSRDVHALRRDLLRVLSDLG